MFKFFRHYIPKYIVVVGMIESFILLASIWVALFFYYKGGETDALGSYAVNIYVYAFIFVSVIQAAMISMGLYHRDIRENNIMVILRIVFSFIIGITILMIVNQLLPMEYFTRGMHLFAICSAFSGVMFSRLLLYQRTDTLLKRKTLVLGAGKRAQLLQNLRRRTDQSGVEIVGYVNLGDAPCYVSEGSLVKLEKPISEIIRENGVVEIVIAVDDRRNSLPIKELLECKMIGAYVVDITSYLERQLGKIDLNSFLPSTIMFSDGFTMNLKSVGKRLTDVVISSVLLILTLPIMFITALAVLYESRGRGSIIYSQERVGLNGNNFLIYKFRSMTNGAEKEGEAVWADKNDCRITRVGAIIRKMRIDELPQLVNVLKGDMSLVGPRPEREQIVEELSQAITYFKLRHFVKPGITGWAQICHSYGASIEDSREKLEYDLYYIKNYSIFLDWVILVQTVAVILWGKGAR